MIRGVVLDIDDTLYLERDYVRSGFEHVASVAAGSPDEASTLSAWMWKAFEAGTRGDTFDLMRQTFPDVGVRTTTAGLVDAYRGHTPRLRLLDGWIPVLNAMARADVRLGVVSDGPLLSQSAKADALRLARWFDPILFTDSLGAEFVKPNTKAFELLAATWRLPHGDLVYVGDNPTKDFTGPRALGWMTIRLRLPLQLRCTLEPATARDGPDTEMGDPTRLLPWLGLDGSPQTDDRS